MDPIPISRSQEEMWAQLVDLNGSVDDEIEKYNKESQSRFRPIPSSALDRENPPIRRHSGSTVSEDFLRGTPTPTPVEKTAKKAKRVSEKKGRGLLVDRSDSDSSATHNEKRKKNYPKVNQFKLEILPIKPEPGVSGLLYKTVFPKKTVWNFTQSVFVDKAEAKTTTQEFKEEPFSPQPQPSCLEDNQDHEPQSETVNLIFDRHLADNFHPDHVYLKVNLYKGNKFYFGPLLDLPNSHFSNVHSLGFSELEGKLCYPYAESIQYELSVGIIISEEIRVLLMQNLQNFYFLDDVAITRLRDTLQMTREKIIFDLFLFLEQLAKSQKLDMALYLVSFICAHKSKSRVFVLQMADFFVRKGFYQPALNVLNIISYVYPEDFYTKALKAYCLLFLTKYQPAKEEISQVIAKYPTCNYSRTLFAAINSFEAREVSSDLDLIIANNPDYVFARALRAECYLHIGKLKYKEAYNEFDELLKYQNYLYARAWCTVLKRFI